ncbi:MAG: glycogen-binding domain-containing protein [Candidatus Hydrothermia bacterium]
MVKLTLILFLLQAVKTTPQGVRFEYYNPQAKSVYLVGDFNNWSPTSHPMRKEEDGTFWIVVKLPPGKYEYKFFVDGQWTADPDNPITVGVYGNSLVRIGENYQVLGAEMPTNTPVSSMVNFNLDARGYLKLDRDTVEGGRLKYRTFDYMQDLKLDVDANLENMAKLWVRIRYNTKTDRDLATQLIPLRFERGLFTVNGTGFNLYAFYNAHNIKGNDPFRLVAEVGEFRRDFGDGEQGVMLSLDRFLLLDKIQLMYSNMVLGDRDLIYTDLGKNFKNFRWGFVLRAQEGLNRLYRVPSPDSLREVVDTTSQLVYFNTYENENLYGSYITYSGGRMGFNLGGVIGDRKLKAGERYVGDNALPTSRSWDKSRILKGIFNISGITGKWIHNFKMDYEKHIYTDLFVRSGGRYFTYYRGKLGTQYNGYFGLNFGYNILKTDSFMNWSYLFEDIENQRISYGEFPFIGYAHYLELSPFVNLSYKGVLLRYEGKLFSYALNQKPFTFENLVRLRFKVFKPIFTYELRTYTVKSSYLNLNKTFVDHFAELAYPIGKNAQLSINYGLNPWNLEDEYFARREYLISQGVDYNLIKNNFLGLGNFLSLAEDALSKERGIQIWLKIAF